MLEYKGYFGEVVYDDEAEVLHVRVINSGPYPIANAEATDVEGLKREFRCSVDVYLEGCKELGIDPVAPTAVPSRNPDGLTARHPGRLRQVESRLLRHRPRIPIARWRLQTRLHDVLPERFRGGSLVGYTGGLT